MRFRLGLLTGGVIGYVLGARAGRARYEQIRTWAGTLRRHPAFLQVRTQVTAVTDLGRGGVAEGLRVGSRRLRQAADDSLVVRSRATVAGGN